MDNFIHFSTSVTAADMTSTIRSFLLFVMSNKKLRMEYLDFMKTVSRTILLGNEKEISNGISFYCMMTLQPQDVLPPKRAPAKYLKFG
jgi:hypothetical protein